MSGDHPDLHVPTHSFPTRRSSDFRIENSSIRNLKIDLTYAWSDRTIWGIDGVGANQQAVSGDNVFANVAYKTPVGTLTGFAYLVDQDETVVLAKSSQTRSEEHTSELQSLMRNSYAVFSLKKK